MELKCCCTGNGFRIAYVLIIPYGIEIGDNESKRPQIIVLIIPYGIEILHQPAQAFPEEVLIIPYGIEIY